MMTLVTLRLVKSNSARPNSPDAARGKERDGEKAAEVEVPANTQLHAARQDRGGYAKGLLDFNDIK